MKKIIIVLCLLSLSILVCTIVSAQTEQYPLKFPSSFSFLKKQKIHTGPPDSLEYYQYPVGEPRRYTIDATIEHLGSFDRSVPVHNFIKDVIAYQDSFSKEYPNIFVVKDFSTGRTSGAIIKLKKNWFGRKRWVMFEVYWDGIRSVPPGTKAFFLKMPEEKSY